MRMFPAAKFNDDLLDICIVSDLGKLNFLQLFPMVYSGKHVEQQQVHHGHEGQEHRN